jgi:hypothetical protein
VLDLMIRGVTWWTGASWLKADGAILPVRTGSRLRSGRNTTEAGR